MKSIYSLLCSILILPALAQAQSASFDALLAQAPAPPKTIAEAVARWQPGHNDNASQVGYDKSAAALLDKLKGLEGTGVSEQKIGGDSAQDIATKMKSMTQAQQMAYAMQLAKKMQQDQQAAYTSGNGQALMQAQQNDVADAQKGLASTTAAAKLSAAEDWYNQQKQALNQQFTTAVEACPEHAVGEMNARNMDCAQPLIDKYVAGTHALAVQYFTKVTAIWIQNKKDATVEIKGWEADINSVQASSSDTAQDTITRKKELIYGEIQALAQMSDTPVNHGHDVANMNPKLDCGPGCDL